MDLYCTRPGCARPKNVFSDLDAPTVLKATRQKFCQTCGMPLLLADRYLPERLLGQGGFGAAYLARDRYTPGRRPCVVKQFRPAGQLNPSQMQLAHDLFVREAEVLEQLGQEHLQIPDLYAFFDLEVPGALAGSQETYFYLVQEYIEGQDLEHELRQRGKFSEAEVLEILAAALSILEFVHAQGTIHRDIKPSNLMRSKKGRLYLLDFGAIKYATAQAVGSSRASTSIFSPGYAPPEQMSGDQVFFSTDLYALAATCVELLTGKPPRELFDAVYQTWRWQDFVLVGEPLATVLHRMLERLPNDRYSSASEVLQALHLAPPPPMPTNLPGSQGSGTALQGATPVPRPVQTIAPIPVPSPVPIPVPSPVSVPVPPPAVAPVKTPVRTPAPPPAPLPAPRFSGIELLGNAAFTGVEGALLAIALYQLPLPLPLPGRAILWLAIALLLIFLQSQRVIERVDLLIILAVTALPVWWFVLQKMPPQVWVLIGLVGLGAIAVTAVFALIYQILIRMFS